jgi:hypothetical protein
MNGNVEPVWSPTTVADAAAVTNEDEPSTATDASTTTTMPITWNTNWDDVVYDLRGDEELYAYFLANFGGRVAGVEFQCIVRSKASFRGDVRVNGGSTSIIPTQLREGVGVSAAGAAAV